MAKPIIATNWSGPTAFMTEENSFPLRIDGLDEIKEGPWKDSGMKWARPSVQHLRELMRFVHENPEIAIEKGKRARQDMLERFTPKKIAEDIMSHFIRINEKVQQEKKVKNQEKQIKNKR